MFASVGIFKESPRALRFSIFDGAKANIKMRKCEKGNRSNEARIVFVWMPSAACTQRAAGVGGQETYAHVGQR